MHISSQHTVQFIWFVMHLKPKRNPVPTSSLPVTSPTSLSPSPLQSLTYFLSLWTCLSWPFRKNWIVHSVAFCVWFLSFKHNVLQVHLCWGMSQYFIPFYCQVTFHRVDVSPFTFLFIGQWIPAPILNDSSGVASSTRPFLAHICHRFETVSFLLLPLEYDTVRARTRLSFSHPWNLATGLAWCCHLQLSLLGDFLHIFLPSVLFMLRDL